MSDLDLESQGNVICDLNIDDGSLSDKWSGWNSYKWYVFELSGILNLY